MTELVLSWDLTPTERRIAETAFAISRIDYDPLARAYDAVIAVRSLRGDIRDRQVTLMEREQMLVELRREPEQGRTEGLHQHSAMHSRQTRPGSGVHVDTCSCGATRTRDFRGLVGELVAPHTTEWSP